MQSLTFPETVRWLAGVAVVLGAVVLMMLAKGVVIGEVTL